MKRYLVGEVGNPLYDGPARKRRATATAEGIIHITIGNDTCDDIRDSTKACAGPLKENTAYR